MPEIRLIIIEIEIAQKQRKECVKIINLEPIEINIHSFPGGYSSIIIKHLTGRTHHGAIIPEHKDEQNSCH